MEKYFKHKSTINSLLSNKLMLQEDGVCFYYVYRVPQNTASSPLHMYIRVGTYVLEFY